VANSHRHPAAETRALLHSRPFCRRACRRSEHCSSGCPHEMYPTLEASRSPKTYPQPAHEAAWSSRTCPVQMKPNVETEGARPGRDGCPNATGMDRQLRSGGRRSWRVSGLRHWLRSGCSLQTMLNHSIASAYFRLACPKRIHAGALFRAVPADGSPLLQTAAVSQLPAPKGGRELGEHASL